MQGVGFRPFIWRIATAAGVSGFCQNTPLGARIEIQGNQESIARFEALLARDLPPLARITSLSRESLPALAAETGFEIRASETGAARNVLVSPDMAVCGDCLADIRDPANPRFGYEFANCVNCGPRFSITAAIPYDRPATTMACFPLCASCQAEYANPADRRFHAQPIACRKCGPGAWLASAEDLARGKTAPTEANREEAIAKAAQALASGQIVAIRGLGGFQLACDALNSGAVTRLRELKRRPHKALAVMARDIASIEKICELAPAARELLAGGRKPIVICPPKSRWQPMDWLCPDCAACGFMLPYTPLHALLFDALAACGHASPFLVMTSGNPAGEPICLGNREALDRLDGMADAWLLHDRDILCRVDDSVAMTAGDSPMVLRRARGFAPAPFSLPEEAPPVLGCGAHLKATFCLTRGTEAFMGQHIGDLESPASWEFYDESLAHLRRLLAVSPSMVIYDLHPDFASTRFARAFAKESEIPAIALQHHAAHAAACLCEHGIYEPALALCLDGSGLGTDGAIWGGELLYMNLAIPEWRRLGHLDEFALPGGEAAIRQPWRIATGLRWAMGQADWQPEEKPLAEMLAKNMNCPPTTSCGRLFDAVSAQLGLCREITYEGQAAIRLEKAALEAAREKIPDWRIGPIQAKDGLRLPSLALFGQALRMQADGEEISAIALAFHYNLALSLAQMAAKSARENGLSICALTGGAIANSLLLRFLRQFLKDAGIRAVVPCLAPPGDGGISLGQAAWGARLLKGGDFQERN